MPESIIKNVCEKYKLARGKNIAHQCGITLKKKVHSLKDNDFKLENDIRIYSLTGFNLIIISKILPVY